MMAGLLITSIGSGQLISRFGRYRPFPIAGTAIMAIGLALLSRLHVDTSTLVAGVYMLVLGLGLGMVMQVLVLAAQNAVDYKYLGVAPPARRCSAQIGGSIGVAIFGAIFANQLATNLAAKLPAGAAVPSSPNPAALRQLPPAAHAAYVAAITEALQPVFVAASVAAVLAFLLSWLLPELPLRTTAQAPDVGDGFHAARDDNALREIERSLSVLAGREQRWELYQRVAARAGVELEPPELWLLARLGERAPLDGGTAGRATARRCACASTARSSSSAGARSSRPETTARSRSDAGTTTTTSDWSTARCDGLRELLAGWHPDQQPEVQEMVDRLGRDLVSEIPTPPPAVSIPVGA